MESADSQLRPGCSAAISVVDEDSQDSGEQLVIIAEVRDPKVFKHASKSFRRVSQMVSAVVKT